MGRGFGDRRQTQDHNQNQLDDGPHPLIVHVWRTVPKPCYADQVKSFRRFIPILIVAATGVGLILWRAHLKPKGEEISWGLLSTVEKDFVPARLELARTGMVRIAGFVVPLSDSFTSITEFLLVPDSMSCIHAPPPPENQMILVRIAKPIDPQLAFGPVWVYGQLILESQSHFFGEAMFQLSAQHVEVYKDEGWGSQRVDILQARSADSRIHRTFSGTSVTGTAADEK